MNGYKNSTEDFVEGKQMQIQELGEYLYNSSSGFLLIVAEYE